MAFSQAAQVTVSKGGTGWLTNSGTPEMPKACTCNKTEKKRESIVTIGDKRNQKWQVCNKARKTEPAKEKLCKVRLSSSNVGDWTSTHIHPNPRRIYGREPVATTNMLGQTDLRVGTRVLQRMLREGRSRGESRYVGGGGQGVGSG